MRLCLLIWHVWVNCFNLSVGFFSVLFVWTIFRNIHETLSNVMSLRATNLLAEFHWRLCRHSGDARIKCTHQHIRTDFKHCKLAALYFQDIFTPPQYVWVKKLMFWICYAITILQSNKSSKFARGLQKQVVRGQHCLTNKSCPHSSDLRFWHTMKELPLKVNQKSGSNRKNIYSQAYIRYLSRSTTNLNNVSSSRLIKNRHVS